MAKCFFCGTILTSKEGKAKIWASISDNDVAVVEIESPLFCCDCKEHYLTTDQLVKGFEQIHSMEQKKTPIKVGVYS